MVNQKRFVTEFINRDIFKLEFWRKKNFLLDINYNDYDLEIFLITHFLFAIFVVYFTST